MEPVSAAAAWVFALFGIVAVVIVARHAGALRHGDHEDEEAQHVRGSWP